METLLLSHSILNTSATFKTSPYLEQFEALAESSTVHTEGISLVEKCWALFMISQFLLLPVQAVSQSLTNTNVVKLRHMNTVFFGGGGRGGKHPVYLFEQYSVFGSIQHYK